jgi:hypothetical protein
VVLVQMLLNNQVSLKEEDLMVVAEKVMVITVAVMAAEIIKEANNN